MSIHRGRCWLPNLAEYMLLQFATARLGAILVTLNPAYRAQELVHAMAKTECKVIALTPAVASSDYSSILGSIDPSALPSLENVLVVPTSSQKSDQVLAHSAVNSIRSRGYSAMLSDDVLLAARQRDPPKDVIAAALCSSLAPSEPIMYQFTSGTTGLPKAVSLSHCNIVHNAVHIASMQRLTNEDRVCIPVPMYHCFGIVLGSLSCTSAGAAVVFPASNFQPEATLRAVEKHRCTSLYGVPTMFIAELALPAFKSYDLSSLRTGIMAGSNCPQETMKRVQRDMHMSEVTIAYGMTETSPVSWQSSHDTPLAKRVSTVGRIHPHVECKVWPRSYDFG